LFKAIRATAPAEREIMPRDAAGKRLLAAALREYGVVKAEQGLLADAIELLDASKVWKSAAKHDAKLDRRERRSQPSGG
jgi:hypothetical protein